jgi:hypothetical protein
VGAYHNAVDPNDPESKRTDPVPQAELLEFSRKFFRDAKLSAKLVLAGAEIVPSDTVPVSDDGTAVWSIRLKERGNFSGAVQLVAATQPSSENGSTFTENDLKFKIDVASRGPDWTQIVGWITTFGGPLLTLPGILAFVQARRKDKGSSDASAEPLEENPPPAPENYRG